jgi:hypothetical protein
MPVFWDTKRKGGNEPWVPSQHGEKSREKRKQETLLFYDVNIT